MMMVTKMAKTKKRKPKTDARRYAEQVGLKMVEATEPLILEVVRRDITNAKPGCKRYCVFANAARRLGAGEAFFDRGYAYLADHLSKTMTRYRQSEMTKRSIRTFDRTKTAEPGIYELLAISPSDTLAAKAMYNAGRKDRSGGPPVQKKRVVSFPPRKSVPIVSRVST